LIVEDNVDLRELLALLIGSAGYIVDVAGDGNEGLRCVAACRPAAVVLDFSMPRMDGEEFARQLRTSPRGVDVPVILLTAQPRADALARRIGAVAHIAKPFDPAHLLTVLARLTAPARAEYDS